MRSSMMLAALLGLGSCDSESAENVEADGASEACPDSQQAAALTVQNRTGNAIAEITMRACDGSELVEFPVPDGGLPTGEDLTLDLAAPGCWILSYTGEGCFNDPVHQTPTSGVCGGDTYVWTAGEDTHGCSGAGW